MSRRAILTVLLTLAGFLCISAGVQAGVLPRCAVIADPQVADVIPPELIDAELAKTGTVTLVERARIGAIFQERQVEALLGPVALSQRQGAGNMLGADLLVIIHALPQKEKDVAVLVCETRRGLRLSEGIAEKATDVASIMADALSQLKDQNAIIAAVPPFIDQDLTFQHVSDSGAYAKIVEQGLKWRGLLVVELAEAKALADEVAVAGGENPSRPLPLYFVGEFRNTLNPSQSGRSLTIGLELRRGRAVLGRVAKSDIAPDQAADALESATAELLQAVPEAQRVPRPESRSEAAMLSARADTFLRLGNWQEAGALIDASLLLDPDQTRLHRNAVVVISRRLHSPGLRIIGNSDSAEGNAALQRALFDEALSHLEAYLRAPRVKYRTRFGEPRWHFRGATADDDAQKDAAVLYDLLGDRIMLKRLPGPPTNIQLHEMVVRIMQAKEASKQKDDVLELTDGLVDWADGGSDMDARRNQLALVKKCPDTFASADDVIRFFALSKPGYPDEGSPAFRWAMHQLAIMPVPLFRQAGTTAQRRLAEELMPYSDQVRLHEGEEAPQTPAPPAHAQITFAKLSLHAETVPASIPQNLKPTFAETGNFAGWCPAGPNIDAIWSDRVLYLMKRRGELCPMVCIRTHGVCFDGRYLWAAAAATAFSEMPSADIALIVLDPQTEQVHLIRPAPGTAPVSLDPDTWGMAKVMIAPIAPGRVCVAGTFGRNWIATASWDPRGGDSFHVFFEARDQPTAQVQQWENAHWAFEPMYMVPIMPAAGSGGANPVRILLGREYGWSSLDFHPLLIDPQRGTVDVVKDAISVHPNAPNFWCEDGAVYWTQNDVGGGALCRFGYPGPAVSKVAATPVIGAVGKSNGRVVINNTLHRADSGGDDWAISEAFGGPYRVVQGRLPTDRFAHLFAMRKSQFYGLVLISPAADAAYSINVDSTR